MTDLNPTSPQLQLFNKFKEAFLSRDLEGVRPLISKSYVFQMLPKMPEEPDDSGEGMMQRHGRLLAAITKIEVRVTAGNGLRAHRLTSTTASLISTN